ncbi:MAG: diphosphate--fructose-6-phosphate 1-phosphotransferase [Verrucomicrobia bacterium]|nr:diphosphate--fructose-6-phosphate 1-phosphotransferase [Verrucomicrobiota bacterium]
MAPMNSNFKIHSLGECRFDSPLDSRFFVDNRTGVLVDATIRSCRKCNGNPDALEATGPRRRIFFNPRKTHAAVVTCGGICPGLNDVIRSLSMVLWHRYGVRKITGFRYGFAGITPTGRSRPIRLTPERVADIHQDGGTILGTSRGPQDPGVMLDFMVRNRIDILFAIGGDGTQRGALTIVNEIRKRGLGISVVGIPKTIDNDILYTERTFGFETAVAMSRGPITCAHMEAKGAFNGVGLVKLMGRESGFVAAYATLASSDVNLVLIPEVSFSIPKLMVFLQKRLARKSHAVIVVAEGAGQEFVTEKGTDASGNKKLGDIGLFLKKAITDHFATLGREVNVKYIDPSYTIRSAPATPDDSVFCFQLAENAAHAAMAGKTGMLIGLWNGHFVHVPMERAVESRKMVDPSGDLWQSVLDNTGQPPDLG